MIVQDVITHLEVLAPLAYAEEFDNVGLLVGDKNSELTGVLVTLDTLESVVDEAIENQCNLIVSFHPIIFKGLKKITGKTYVERVLIKAIEHKIAIYAIHTALDNAFEGANAGLCELLGLKNKAILIPQAGTIKQLTTYVPEKNADAVKTALFACGAGSIGNYTDCSFSSVGTGTFKGNEHSNPVIGAKHELQKISETKLTFSFAKHLEHTALKALFSSHPYEEVAYEIVSLENTNQHIGMGMIGQLEYPMDGTSFIKVLKTQLNCSVIRHSALLDTPIQKVAVLGGSGRFAIEAAKAADVGHYESEQHIKNILVAHLKKKITNFAVLLSKTNTNPVKYK